MAAPSSSLYVRNLPPNVTEPLLVAAFSQQPGFTTARLRMRKSGQAYAFVEFVDVAAGSAAFSRYQGYRFSPTDPQGIAVEFAKETRPRGQASGMPGHPAAAGPPPSMPAYGQSPPAMQYAPQQYAPPPAPAAAGPAAYGGAPPPPGAYGGAPPPPGAYGGAPPPPGAYGGAAPPPGAYGGAAPPPGAYGGYGRPPAPGQPPSADATATLYIEGVPDDASERELAHLFRPFDGFEAARLVPHGGRNGRKMYLCFAEFRSPVEAFAAMQVIHNYDIDPRESGSKRLRISFARKPPRSRGDGRQQRDFAADVELDKQRRRTVQEVEDARAAASAPSGAAAAQPVVPAKSAAGGAQAKAPGAQAQARPSGRREEDQPAWARQARKPDAAAGRDEDRASAAAMDARSGEACKEQDASDAIVAADAAPEAGGDAERPE
ncbi:hypothetical protein FNF29_05063 [Cafeteria roenbergensis]|uniref:RRM domain-containing protein n=1 Tax=Cafeteria roenbergensis TaxID=33653 RepID=A0A5A8CCA7_CAFRO|nr:hypothetical protein FNF29_05063 [Cafeteria roenbergensis]|eukprot:KAA0150726.1 hypothetical protein FNF29_05063 [Cafeteria roenbergensis]